MDIFQKPKFEYLVTCMGCHLSDDTMVNPDQSLTIKVATMCGKENATLEVSPAQSMTASEAVRRAQLASSIHHVTRRNCTDCRNQYQHGCNAIEKHWLWSVEPKLGPILGIDRQGPYGAPTAPIMPEDLGITDESLIATARQEAQDAMHRSAEQAKKLKR